MGLCCSKTDTETPLFRYRSGVPLKLIVSTQKKEILQYHQTLFSWRPIDWFKVLYAGETLHCKFNNDLFFEIYVQPDQTLVYFEQVHTIGDLILNVGFANFCRNVFVDRTGNGKVVRLNLETVRDKYLKV